MVVPLLLLAVLFTSTRTAVGRRVEDEPTSCGGFAGTTCPSEEYVCVYNANDGNCKLGTDCEGSCLLTCSDDMPCASGFECIRNNTTGYCQKQFCGGIAGIECPDGFECVDDPKDDCDPLEGGADCGGICEKLFCGGIAGIACPDGFVCVDNACNTKIPSPAPSTTSQPTPVATTIISPTLGPTSIFCGGIGGIQCPDELVCVDGVCQLDSTSEAPAITSQPTPDSTISSPAPAPTDIFCGGIAAVSCPDGYVCLDDPSDDCHPLQGGADCGGICQLKCSSLSPCPNGHTCTPNDDSCVPTIDQACDGICQQVCVGIAGIPCFQPGFACVSDGSCDPQTTSDCAGVCMARCDDASCPQGLMCINHGIDFECSISLVCLGISCGEGDVCVLNGENNPECVPVAPTSLTTATTAPTPTIAIGEIIAPDDTAGASPVNVLSLLSILSIASTTVTTLLFI